MKRSFCVIIAAVLLVVLSACGGSGKLIDCKVETQDVKSGSGETIGQRAYVSVSKEVLTETTQEEFLKFAEDVVDNSGYNWFTIMCDDGTGIVFNGSNISIPAYGKLDDEGAIAETLGFIDMGPDGTYTYTPAG